MHQSNKDVVLHTKDTISAGFEKLFLAELERLQGWFIDLIEERRTAELERKGNRVVNDMRGLMAKAGISMDEFQTAIAGTTKSN